MRLEGRLSGHFLGRVALLVGGLGLVFLLWIGGLALSTFQTQQAASPPTDILRRAATDTRVTGETVTLGAETIAAARDAGCWIQVLDESGDEVTQSGRPADAPTRYTPGGLVLARQRPSSVGMAKISTWVETIGGRELTFILGKSVADTSAGPQIYLGGDAPVPQPRLLALMVALLVGGAAVVLGSAWLFGRGLSRPLVHMMRWLSALAEGDFAEPVDRMGQPASRIYAGGARKRPYRTYREVFDALDALTAELRSTAEERQRLEDSRNEWIAGVSHDLRTPLTSIQGYSDVLASDYEFDAAEVRRQASVIARQASHMDALLDDLNLSFRLRADALPLNRELVDLVELVRELAVELANDPRSEGREVIFIEPAGGGRLSAEVDSLMLRRSVMNILVNAVIHNPAGTTVTTTLGRSGGLAYLEIADDGAGMTAETRGRLFDRYFRGTSTGADVAGTGLGMAIAKQIIDAHGGSIDVSSASGRGTTVRLTLPLLPS